MKPGRARILDFLAFALLLFPVARAASAAEAEHQRVVYLGPVQGDVRLSRGDGKHAKLSGAWELAQAGEPIEQGFALATGGGRVEIDFEDGSAVYLAENSVMLFTELSASGGSVKSRLTLPTGVATFSLQPAISETFFIVTPMDTIQISLPNTFFARINAYLDATAVTVQGAGVSELSRYDRATLQVASGHTIFFRGGEILPGSLNGATRSVNTGPVSDSVQLQLLPISSENSSDRASDADTASQEWDQWVAARVQEKKANLAAALKASGLSAPVPGLEDLYAQGTFFKCAPYGTCWDPAEQELPQASVPPVSSPTAQLPKASAPSTVFQPQTVEFTEVIWGVCGIHDTRVFSRVAHTQAELDELLRLKAKYESAQGLNLQRANWGRRQSCYNQSWIPRGRHYAMVVRRPCVPGVKCKPERPPRPVFVRVAGKIGFVPRHPDDVAGKAPLNLKNGMVLAGAKPGEPAELLGWDASQKVKFLEKAPKDFERDFAPRVMPAGAPLIRAQLLEQPTRGNPLTAENRGAPQIVYNYKKQQFMTPIAVGGSGKTREIPVASVASRGATGSLPAPHSSHSGSATYQGGANSASRSSASGGSSASSSRSSGGGGGSMASSAGSSSSSSSSSSSGSARSH
jgi:hypothetical protein